MKRKVVQHGPSLTITLPSVWVKKYRVEKGDELSVSEYGEKLIISGENSKPDHKKVQVDITDLDKKTCSGILSLMYKLGYDEIYIKCDDSRRFNDIQEAIKNHLLGFTIMDQKANSCLLKCVSKELKEEFDKSLRRAFLVTLSLAESSLKFIKNKEYSHLSDLDSLEIANNQLTNFCERLLNKDLIGEKGTTFRYVITWQLEKIADEYKEILYELRKGKIEISFNIQKLFEKTNALLREYYEAFYKKDLKKLTDLYKEKDINDWIRKEIRAKNPIDLMVVSHLLHIISKIVELVPSTIALNRVFEDGIKI